MNAQSVDTRFIYVGTFTGVDDHGGGAEGIYVCRMDMASGAVELVHTVPDVPNPSFLTLHPERPFLYAVNAVPGDRRACRRDSERICGGPDYGRSYIPQPAAVAGARALSRECGADGAGM